MANVRARVTSYTEPAWADNQDGANVRMALLDMSEMLMRLLCRCSWRSTERPRTTRCIT